MDTNITIFTDNGKKNLWNILFSVCLLLFSWILVIFVALSVGGINLMHP